MRSKRLGVGVTVLATTLSATALLVAAGNDAATTTPPSAPPPSPGQAADEGDDLPAIDALVFHCNDGDTCRVRIAGSVWMNVRLAGIDAPEVSHGKKRPGQPLGGESRDFLNSVVKGKSVKLRQTDLDQYNRPVVELTAGEIAVNRTMVENGFAEAYRGKTRRLDNAAYFAAEAAAKKARKGVWGLASYQSPAEFRKQR
jgi:endonuclease YncB( thermonuclease family)